MKTDDNNEKQIEAILNSIDNIQRASPAPYLHTRINARLNNPVRNIWENISSFISRPAVMVAGICLILTINISVLVVKNTSTAGAFTERSYTIAGEDDEYTNLATIDNIETQ